MYYISEYTTKKKQQNSLLDKATIKPVKHSRSDQDQLTTGVFILC